MIELRKKNPTYLLTINANLHIQFNNSICYLKNWLYFFSVTSKNELNEETYIEFEGKS